MDVRLTPEQEQMQATAREFLEANGGIELARAVMDGDETEIRATIDGIWGDLTALDYTALTVPVAYDGLGDGMVHLAVLLEALGRYAMPGPYPETMAFGVPLLAELGSHAQQDAYLPAIVNGDLKLSFGLYENPDEALPDSIQMTADPTDAGYRLTGTKTLVPYAATADRVIVAARTHHDRGFGGISLFLVDPADGVLNRLAGLDRTRPVYELDCQDVVVDPEALLGPLHGGGEALRRAMDRYTVAACMMLVGAADRAVELSVEHGNERTQYGNPVGMYQAVKHRIVDMWMDVEQARVLVYYAAWAIQHDDPDAVRAVSAAKAFCGERCRRIFTDDIKNHGGMGFTWDHDTHIYLKQAKAWEPLFGDVADHLDRVAGARGF